MNVGCVGPDCAVRRRSSGSGRRRRQGRGSCGSTPGAIPRRAPGAAAKDASHGLPSSRQVRFDDAPSPCGTARRGDARSEVLRPDPGPRAYGRWRRPSRRAATAQVAALRRLRRPGPARHRSRVAAGPKIGTPRRESGTLSHGRALRHDAVSDLQGGLASGRFAVDHDTGARRASTDAVTRRRRGRILPRRGWRRPTEALSARGMVEAPGIGRISSSRVSSEGLTT